MTAQPSTAAQDKTLLLRAYECKIRSKFNIQEFLEIVHSNARLTKMGEKGLFLLYLCEMLLKAYVSNGIRVRNFISELDKKEAKKRQRREGGGGERRKKRKPKDSRRGAGQGKTLEQLSNESLSNPSNVERPRINAETRPDQSANSNLPQLPSKEKGDDSNGSKDDSKKNQLKIELNKITEEIRGQEDTYVPDVDFLPGTNTFEDNSQSSSSQNTGEISNLSEKLKILTSVKENQRRGTTTRRKGANGGTAVRDTRTKKKKYYDIIDHSTFIEETRATDNDITFLNYNETSHFDTQQVADLDLVNNFLSNLNLDDKPLTFQLFAKDKIEYLKNVIKVENQGQPHDMSQNFGMMSNEQYNLPLPDYTMSQPTSAPLFEPDFFKQSLQIKDSQFNFQDLVTRSSKDKSTLFYQLLWREQNDEISLYQKNPEIFSSIMVKHR